MVVEGTMGFPADEKSQNKNAFQHGRRDLPHQQRMVIRVAGTAA